MTPPTIAPVWFECWFDDVTAPDAGGMLGGLPWGTTGLVVEPPGNGGVVCGAYVEEVCDVNTRLGGVCEIGSAFRMC